jgi:hypothetical protein
MPYFLDSGLRRNDEENRGQISIIINIRENWDLTPVFRFFHCSGTPALRKASM